MALPHYTQSKASINKYEPVYQNLFELTLISPVAIGGTFDTPLMLQHIESIEGVDGTNPNIDAITQKFKFSDRSFAGMPAQTYIDLQVVATVNLNRSNEAYVYKQIRDWYKLAYDPITAEMGLKIDYTGSAIVTQYNRKGDIFRKVTFKDVFVTGQLGFTNSLSVENPEAAKVTFTLRTDYWTEELA